MAVVTRYINRYWTDATPKVWTESTSDAFQMVRNTGVVCTKVDCTNAGTNTADVEKLVITPIRPGIKLLVIVTAVTYDVTVTIDAGDYWFAKALGAVTVSAGTSRGFTLEGARYKTKILGQIIVSIINDNSHALNGDASYQVIEMPDVDLNTIKTLADTE